MRSINKLMLAACLLSTAFVSCKDDDDNNTPAETTTQKIQHKWSLASMVEVFVTPSNTETQNRNGLPGDYVDFRTDGKVYGSFFGIPDTMSYSVISDNYLLIDGDSTRIQNLTNNILQLYSVGQDNDTSSFQITTNLTR